MVNFLEKAQKLDSYPQVEEYLYQSLKVLDQEIKQSDRERRLIITELERLLEKNIKSRDVLVALAFLYKESEDIIKYEEYMKRAQEIDPSIQI